MYLNGKRSSFARFSLVIMGLLLFVGLTGCSTVDSIVWMDVLKKRYDITSGEGTMELSFKLMSDAKSFANATTADRDTYKHISGFDGTVLSYSRKKQDAKTWSWDGAIALKNGLTLPIKANVRDGQLAVAFEGIANPLVIPMNVILTRNGWQNLPLSSDMKSKFDHRFAEIMPLFSTYFASKMPEPEGVSVSLESIDSQGESISTVHAHMDMDSNTLKSFMSGLVQNVLSDPAGRTALTEKILALLTVAENVPADKAVVAESDKWLIGILSMYIENIFKDIQTNWKLPNAQDHLLVDWWIDKDLAVRQFSFDLTYYPIHPWAGVNGYQIAWKRSTWNVGSAVVSENVPFEHWSYDKLYDEKKWITQAAKGTKLNNWLGSFYQTNRKTIVLKYPNTLKSPKKVTPVKTQKAKAAVVAINRVTNADGTSWTNDGKSVRTSVNAKWLAKQLGLTAQYNAKAQQLTIANGSVKQIVSVGKHQVELVAGQPFTYLNVLSMSLNVQATYDPSGKQWNVITDP